MTILDYPTEMTLTGNRQEEQLSCITHEMSDFRDCTLRDQHYNDYRDQTAHLETCTGCLPRPARVGLVCTTCAEKVEEGWNVWGDMRTALEGVDRAMSSEGDTSSVFGPSLPLAPVPLALDEIQSYSRSFTGTVERWVSSEAGARDGLRFARAVRSTATNHPVAETAHAVEIMRCQNPDCAKLALLWHPPQYAGGQASIRCEACGWVADQSSYEVITEILNRQRRKKAS